MLGVVGDDKKVLDIANTCSAREAKAHDLLRSLPEKLFEAVSVIVHLVGM